MNRRKTDAPKRMDRSAQILGGVLIYMIIVVVGIALWLVFSDSEAAETAPQIDCVYVIADGHEYDCMDGEQSASQMWTQ